MAGFRRTTQPETKQDTTPPVSKSTPSKGGGGGAKKTYHNDVMTIFKKEDSKSGVVDYFLSLDQKNSDGLEITVNGKTVSQIFTKDPIVELERSVDEGRLTEERAQEIANKMQNIITKNGDRMEIVGKVTLVTE